MNRIMLLVASTLLSLLTFQNVVEAGFLGFEILQGEDEVGSINGVRPANEEERSSLKRRDKMPKLIAPLNFRGKNAKAALFFNEDRKLTDIYVDFPDEEEYLASMKVFVELAGQPVQENDGGLHQFMWKFQNGEFLRVIYSKPFPELLITFLHYSKCEISEFC
jgi:hypothetical protein